MSFLHVLGEIGKGALSVGSVVAKGIPGPLGLVVTTGINIANQEINGGTGEKKKEAVIDAVKPLVADKPGAVDGITKILEGLVMVFNGLAIIFPKETPPSA